VGEFEVAARDGSHAHGTLRMPGDGMRGAQEISEVMEPRRSEITHARARRYAITLALGLVVVAPNCAQR